jgi:hypothetical protein
MQCSVAVRAFVLLPVRAADKGLDDGGSVEVGRKCCRLAPMAILCDAT